MDAKTILSRIAFIGGEAIIVAAFFLWGALLPTNIFVLNLIVATIAYCAIFIDILIPWVDFSDRAGRSVGSLGLRWVVTLLYGLLAVAAMIVCNVPFDVPFAVQVIIHCVLVLGLVLGLVAVLSASDKVAEVHAGQQQVRQGLALMKQAAAALKNSASLSAQVPQECMRRIATIEENMRFISPNNSAEAENLERQFAAVVNGIAAAISNYDMNQRQIETDLSKAELIYNQRRNLLY